MHNTQNYLTQSIHQNRTFSLKYKTEKKMSPGVYKKCDDNDGEKIAGSINKT